MKTYQITVVISRKSKCSITEVISVKAKHISAAIDYAEKQYLKAGHSIEDIEVVRVVRL